MKTQATTSRAAAKLGRKPVKAASSAQPARKTKTPQAPTPVAPQPARKPRGKTTAPKPATTRTIIPEMDAPAPSKQAQLIGLLQSAPGATIEQMMGLTGWQAHTVRGTISGVLRKRLGLNVACSSTDAGRVYRIMPVQA